jgi:phosphoglycerate kinase
MTLKPLRELELKNRLVIVRADLNTRFNENGDIADDFRIKQFAPTVQYLSSQGARSVILSHAGTPDNRSSLHSLRPAAEKLNEILGATVHFCPSRQPADLQDSAASLAPGESLVIENLAQEASEVHNSLEFAKTLACLGDLYVNDSFSICANQYASICALPQLIEQKALGLLMEKEFSCIERAISTPKRPIAVVIGGFYAAKKIEALSRISKFADTVILGGAVANTFLAAQGVQMGRSLYESDLFPRVFEILAALARRDAKVYLPVDFRVGPSPSAKKHSRAVTSLEVPADSMALDIGPASSILFKEALQSAETIIWNGFMGALENEDYSEGTTGMIEHLASSHGLTVAGGENTYAAIRAMELRHKFDCVVPGDTAFVTMLEGRELPGLSALGLKL